MSSEEEINKDLSNIQLNETESIKDSVSILSAAKDAASEKTKVAVKFAEDAFNKVTEGLKKSTSSSDPSEESDKKSKWFNLHVKSVSEIASNVVQTTREKVAAVTLGSNNIEGDSKVQSNEHEEESTLFGRIRRLSISAAEKISHGAEAVVNSTSHAVANTAHVVTEKINTARAHKEEADGAEYQTNTNSEGQKSIWDNVKDFSGAAAEKIVASAEVAYKITEPLVINTAHRVSDKISSINGNKGNKTASEPEVGDLYPEEKQVDGDISSVSESPEEILQTSHNLETNVEHQKSIWDNVKDISDAAAEKLAAGTEAALRAAQPVRGKVTDTAQNVWNRTKESTNLAVDRVKSLANRDNNSDDSKPLQQLESGSPSQFEKVPLTTEEKTAEHNNFPSSNCVTEQIQDDNITKESLVSDLHTETDPKNVI